MGGSKSQPVPAAPQQIDYGALMASAANASAEAYMKQLQSQIEAYP
jgi:hypothetical protein